MSSWQPHSDGSTLSVDGINAEAAILETAVNSIDSSAIQLRSLHNKHLPSMIAAQGSDTVSSSSRVYSNIYPGWANDTISTTTGWQYAGNGTKDLVVTFPAVDLADSSVAGLLVLANIGIEDGGAVCAKLQVQTTTGYKSIERSFRIASDRASATKNLHDISIRTFIKASDLLNTEVVGVRVLVSYSGAAITLGNCNLSAIALYGEAS